MRKIGIITFHRSFNYGSVLQAYALQKYINSNQLGEAKVIDFFYEYDYKQYNLFRSYLYSAQIKSFFADLYYLKRNIKRMHNFEEFIEKYIPLTQKQYTNNMQMKELNKNFDAFICGSDQIWNLEITQGGEPAYFLDFVESNNIKIAYAPSMAHLTFDNLNEKKISNYLKSFDALSVREESTKKFIAKFTDQIVNTVVDPTLLLKKDDYEEILESIQETDYIFVYMLENNDELLAYVKKMSIHTGLKVIYISKKQYKNISNAKNVYGASPKSFLTYIKNADFIITNSFHATVFSIIFEKKFVTFKTKKSFARMVDLLEKLELTDRLYNDEFEINNHINYSIVEKNLNELRSESIKYLEKYI